MVCVSIKRAAVSLFDAFGIFGLEVPCVGTHLINVIFRFPAKFCIGFCGIRIEGGQIAFPSVTDNIVQRLAAGLLKGMDNIQYTIANTVADIIGFNTCGIEYFRYSTQMRIATRAI